MKCPDCGAKLEIGWPNEDSLYCPNCEWEGYKDTDGSLTEYEDSYKDEIADDRYNAYMDIIDPD